MKKILLISFVILSFASFGQTDRELLLKLSDKIDKIAEQQNVKIDKIAEQQIMMSTKIDGMQKQMDVRFEAVDKRFDDANKRIDILLYVMLGIMGGVFGLIGFVI
jgi:hypothetical protein